MGRQPWVVHPNPESVGDPRTELIRMTVDMGVSDHAPWTVIVTLVGFTLVYGALAVVWFWLIRRVVVHGPTADAAPPEVEQEAAPERASTAEPVRFAAHCTAGVRLEDDAEEHED